MANTEQSAGETVAVILFFVGLIIVIYYANYFHKKIQANKEKMLEINSRLISAKDYYDLDFSLLRDDPYSLIRESTK